MPRLSRREVEKLNQELSELRGAVVKLTTDAEGKAKAEWERRELEETLERRRFRAETGFYGVVGSGGMVDMMLTNPNHTIHNVSLGFGTAALLAAGVNVVVRVARRRRRSAR